MNQWKLLLTSVFAFAASLGIAGEPVSSSAGSTDWAYLGGIPQSHQFSPLQQINSANATSLGLIRYTDLPIKEGSVGNPLVRDGIAYINGPRAGATAVDLRSGRVLWNFEAPLDYGPDGDATSMWTVHRSRGLGMDEENVYTTGGCMLFAIARKSGVLVWKTRTCDPTHALGSNSAPRTGGGKVFIGFTNAEAGSERGCAAAFDAKSGQELWRFYTVPGDPTKPFENKQMEIASETWGSKPGAAGVWDGMIYDPATNLLIIGSGNPPHTPPEEGQKLGDHELLYSDSFIGVNATTGEYVWHYQTLAGDAWGISDAASHMILADLQLPGGKRHVLMSAEKQFFYLIDAKTGQFISAGSYVPNTNFSRMDPKTGKLTVREELKLWKHPGTTVVIQPSEWGGHTWTLTAYNAKTGLVYIPAFIIPKEVGPHGREFDYGLAPDAKFKLLGRLIAWDPIAQKERWHVDHPIAINGGVLATDGNLVFQGTVDGKFYAYAADSGKELWSFDTHSVILAAPSTVLLDGKQIIIVPSGDGSGAGTGTYFRAGASTAATMMAPSRLLVFGLGGKEVIPPTPLKQLPKPARARASTDLIAVGERVFESNTCGGCHGMDLQIPGQGRIPDLRAISESTLSAMPAILRGGAFSSLGMPRFPNITEEQITALQAYIESRAWDAYDQQHAGLEGRTNK